MRDAGVEVANLGNNHATTAGPTALVDSRAQPRGAPASPRSGAGSDQEQALAPAMFELEGWTVAVLGFDEVVDPLRMPSPTERSRGRRPGHDIRPDDPRR